MIKNDLISEFICKNHKDAKNIMFLAEGHNSKAYKFSIGEDDFVLRVADKPKFFKNDECIYTHYPNLRVPEFFSTGEIEPGLFYAVTEYVSGVPMATDWEFSKYVDVHTLKDGFIQSLISISGEDVSGSTGYGGLSSTCAGEYSSWRSFLEGWYQNPKVIKRIKAQTDRGNLDEITMSKAEITTKKLLAGSPVYETRHLIHGDYQPHNVVIKDDTVERVLDWGSAKYGDYIYDVVWTTMHGPRVAPVEAFFDEYSKSGFDMENIEVRTKLAKISILISWAMASNENGNFDEARKNQKQLLIETMEK